jgi:hypothetical protein
MFENRINGFMSNMGSASFTPGVFPQVSEREQVNRSPMAVQLADIYQIARQRAVEEIEIDKLFNPDFYDYQI